MIRWARQINRHQHINRLEEDLLVVIALEGNPTVLRMRKTSKEVERKLAVQFERKIIKTLVLNNRNIGMEQIISSQNGRKRN